MTFETAAVRVVGVLFGGVLAFVGLDHFLDLEAMAGYAAFEGLPAPKAAVVRSRVLLVLGGLSIASGVLPSIGTAGLSLLRLASAVTTPDVWTQEGGDAQDETTVFLENLFGAGAAPVFLALASASWLYVLDLGP